MDINRKVKKLLHLSNYDIIIAWTKLMVIEMKRSERYLEGKVNSLIGQWRVEGITGELGEGVNDDFKMLIFTLGMSIFLFSKHMEERPSLENLGHGLCVISVPASTPKRGGKQTVGYTILDHYQVEM